MHSALPLPQPRKRRIIGVTMRLLAQAKTDNMHDALSHDWGAFLKGAGIMWLALPNRGQETLDVAKQLGLDGFIFSGGGDAGGEPDRDCTEALLMQHAMEHGLPILGICRGFQALQLHLQGELVPLKGHVAVRHALWDRKESSLRERHCVNSFHALGINKVAAPLTPLAFSCEPDGTEYVEMAWAPGLLGIMWHPERMQVPEKRDVDTIRHFFTFPRECPMFLR